MSLGAVATSWNEVFRNRKNKSFRAQNFDTGPLTCSSALSQQCKARVNLHCDSKWLHYVRELSGFIPRQTLSGRNGSHLSMTLLSGLALLLYGQGERLSSRFAEFQYPLINTS